MMRLSKNQITIIALAIVLQLLTSCEKSVIGIKGDGPIVSASVDVSEIEGVNLACSGNVYITASKGDVQSSN